MKKGEVVNARKIFLLEDEKKYRDIIMVETPTPSLVRVRTLQQQLMFERRILFFCTALVGFSVIVWVISISTDHWFIVDGGSGIYINETKRMFLRSNSGLWRICRKALGVRTINTTTVFTNVTGDYVEIHEPVNTTNPNFKKEAKLAVIKRCKMHDIFPSEAVIKSNPMLDHTILHYTRTEVIFSIISLILIMMGFFFSFYTFRNPRYMFKRLAGGIHFITCLSVMVVIEVLMSSIVYEKNHLPIVHPKNADYYYGFSYYLACVVFIFNLSAGIAFFWYSKKRKDEDKIIIDERKTEEEFWMNYFFPDDDCCLSIICRAYKNEKQYPHCMA